MSTPLPTLNDEPGPCEADYIASIEHLKSRLRREVTNYQVLLAHHDEIAIRLNAWEEWAATWSREKSSDPDVLRLSIAAQVEERDRLRTAVERMLLASESTNPVRWSNARRGPSGRW